MEKKDQIPSSASDITNHEGVLPSHFMRQLRPEYYSDTEDRVAYVLDGPLLEYHLDSITRRNQTHDFEIFCRKLCERTICPNLRAHTGPDGGGDSKVDTETYPITEDISSTYYIGEEKSAHEKWAFAISAQEDWKSKVKDDVRKIHETERDYKRIIFVTSQFARDKDRADIEDALSKQYNIPVTIHDRSWIVREIIENDRKDIAYSYLGVGQEKTDSLRLGPTDYSRLRQLNDIEQSINDPEAFEGMKRERATEALVAAKLSRNLERPRMETDGRFLRAIRFAEADGTFQQQLKAQYEHIWTSFWWFDDFHFLKDNYERFESLALPGGHAVNLELLCNLVQLFFNAVIHGHMTQEECKLDERIQRLKLALQQASADQDRPNNALEAQTSLLIIQFNEWMESRKLENLPNLWQGFSQVLEKADGMSEFNVDRLTGIIDIAGDIAGNDPGYNALIDKMSEFISRRKSDAEGALILLKRAQKLDLEDSIEIIRLLGKATVSLAKKEYADDLVEALQLLTLAYKHAGLLWAARASCIFLAASLVIEGEKYSKLPVGFVTAMKIWAWIAYELRHIPDFLLSIQLLNGALRTLPLAEKSKEKLNQDLFQLDGALGSLLLNLNDSDLQKSESLPDILEALNLFMARSALLYNMGHIDILREDGSLPATESDDDINTTFSLLSTQFESENLRYPLILNNEQPQTLRTVILGMAVDIHTDGNLQSTLAAEAILGSLDAFFATTLEYRISPHTEKLDLNLVVTDQVSEPSFDIEPMDMIGAISWPSSLAIKSAEHQGNIHDFVTEISGKILATCCMIDDAETLLKKLYADEAVHNRMSIIIHAPNSYHRVTSQDISQISDWSEAIKKRYELKITRPRLNGANPIENKNDTTTKSPKDSETALPKIKDHRQISIRSVIDLHSWDQAGWKGTAYVEYSPTQPPCMALLFENEEAAKKIFSRWQERFGRVDSNEEIQISIIRNLPGKNIHHYCVQVTSNYQRTTIKSGQVISTPSRSLVMEPNNDLNLDRFLKSYERIQAFCLLPAVLGNNGQIELLFEHGILKQNLTVKLASQVESNDTESIALDAINSYSSDTT